ncbi:MAG: helix-turn-helix transcriptional regulator [Paludibacter sp.]|nr:helix-turn-helix transcriptional regulator [Bacteroidales bacterium]MCM1068569.1 helix-turn-helix transcriptional regulator [Prevotella sp.]MCM1353233.1 helix-turn-helix transcriptional regulator [Bacteroides sp.]MCM1442359.1 helix-turn-helix transcriptional regulator [Muribaculum sp.]MCM1481178.1 helix-turn-helix transcriptional regulator [Paludibacter sp.]
MDRISITDRYDPKCPIRNILARISDKWSLLVLHTLAEKDVCRFGELRRYIPDVSQRMLTVTLRTLEEDGLVSRRVYPEVPPRVEYRLTSRALSLLPHIEALTNWAKEHMEHILADRQNHIQQLSKE